MVTELDTEVRITILQPHEKSATLKITTSTKTSSSCHTAVFNNKSEYCPTPFRNSKLKRCACVALSSATNYLNSTELSKSMRLSLKLIFSQQKLELYGLHLRGLHTI